MSNIEPAYADSVYIKTVGPEYFDYNFAVGADYYPRYGISLGKIKKLGVQIGSDAVTVVAKVISDEKEILFVNNFFKNNILCFEAATQYNGELEEEEKEE